jgi:hypothetical protein
MANSTVIGTTLLVAAIIAFVFAATGQAPAGEPRRGEAAATLYPDENKDSSANSHEQLSEIGT